MGTLQKTLRDSVTARWGALLLVSLVMFVAYVASDVYSPLKTILEESNLWTSTEYGYISGAYSVFNVFLCMLIFAGLLLDKKGIRITGTLGCALMVAGFIIKYISMAYIPVEIGGEPNNVTLLGMTMKNQVLYASLGFAIFGTGCEMAGISVSKAIVKWFKGKELAMAMGLQLAIARLGSAGALIFAPMVAEHFHNVTSPVMVGLIALIIGFLLFLVYCIQDKKLDSQDDRINLEAGEEESSFSMKDLKQILSNPGFWIISMICMIFYAAVNPFLRFTSDLMVNNFYDVSPFFSGTFPSLIPFGCILFTPLFGWVYDKYGHGITLMLIGALLITAVHTIFALPGIHYMWEAVILLIILGVGYSMLPSALWPSLAKIMPQKQYGTAIALAFYLQNIGLMLVPIIIGRVLDKYCVLDSYAGGVISFPNNMKYNYTLPEIIFALLCVLSIILTFVLKAMDKKRGYGLQRKSGEGDR